MSVEIRLIVLLVGIMAMTSSGVMGTVADVVGRVLVAGFGS